MNTEYFKRIGKETLPYLLVAGVATTAYCGLKIEKREPIPNTERTWIIQTDSVTGVRDTVGLCSRNRAKNLCELVEMFK